MSGRRIAIVGGGAAGFFAAIRCAELAPTARVDLYEATAHLLAKVRISGGGRCNVTHACFDPRELVQRYPRGAKELLGPLYRFGPSDTVEWFAARGVPLVTEDDGRMFPITNSSATVVEALTCAAADAGVSVNTRCGVRAVARLPGSGFRLEFARGEPLTADRLLIATGGGRDSGGAALARSLGHMIEPQVPSLFTFHIDDPRLRGLEGLSVGNACVSVEVTRLRECGPLLVTHWGTSGPAILRLSAWGARELHAFDYQFVLLVNWAGSASAAAAGSSLAGERATHGRRRVVSSNPFAIPARLWERLVAASGIPADMTWAAVSNAMLNALTEQIVAGRFTVSGKSMNKEEFVTCGGVRLQEVDFRTMESRVCPGLFFAGEVLDIDGITGGFNFQSAWTTGWLAGTAMAQP